MLINKTIFTINYVCFCILLSFPVMLSAQVSTCLNQSFRIAEAQSVSIQVNSPNLKIKYIQGSRVLVEAKISLSIDNSTLLHFIAQNGRYDLTTALDPQTKCLTISPKNKQDLILVKGKELEENISYTIYVPKEIALAGFAHK